MSTQTVFLKLEIKKPDGPFSSDASLLEWVKACLNCNTNHARVDVEVAGADRSRTLSGIDNAFDQVNSLLDGAGALDSESLLQAMYSLRLEIAIAQRDSDRVAAAEASLQELNPALQGLDLRTFDGWCAAAVALLADKPSGAALIDAPFHGYLILVEGALHGLAMREDGDVRFATEWRYPFDAIEVDRSIWDESLQCWEAHDPLLCRKALLLPVYTSLVFEEIAAEQSESNLGVGLD